METKLERIDKVLDEIGASGSNYLCTRRDLKNHLIKLLNENGSMSDRDLLLYAGGCFDGFNLRSELFLDGVENKFKWPVAKWRNSNHILTVIQENLTSS